MNKPIKQLTLLTALLTTYTNAATLEAENAEIKNCFIAKNHEGFTGSGFVAGLFPEKKSEITFLYNSEESKTVTIEIRYAAGAYKTKILLKTPNEEEIIDLPKTVSWKAWQTVTSQITLNKGINSIKIGTIETEKPPINIDNISINLKIPESTKIEAESANLTNCSIAKNHTGFSGNGFVSGLYPKNSSSINFNYDSKNTSTATLEIRYAAGAYKTKITLLVNSAAKIIELPKTKNWKAWKTVTTPIDLISGENSICIQTIATEKPPINIDYFNIKQ